jgi:RNA polymerase sigma-70 factor (ECF subfamily)
MRMDAGLVRSAQGGDEGAFAQIVEASAGRFIAVAQRILHDPVLAEEATQQALVRIWRYLPGLRDPARFDAWSYRLLVKACFTESRGRSRRRLIDSLQREERSAVSDGVDGLADRDQLGRALRRISVDHRAVLVLHYYLDLQLEEVAEVLDVPIGTVYSRLNRAHQALRGVLEADARAPLGTPASGSPR